MPMKMKTKKRKRTAITLSVSDQEKAKFEQIAEKENRSLSNWVRMTLNRLVEQDEKTA